MNTALSRSQVLSVTLHLSLLLALLFLRPLTTAPLPDLSPVLMPLTPRKLLWRTQDGGGGQQHTTPATAGRVAIATTLRPLVPPTSPPLDRTPKLVAEAAIVLETPVAMPQADLLGDPLAKLQGTGSLGPGGPEGIGSGRDSGVGDTAGRRLGSTTSASLLRYTTAPVLVKRIEPEYPEEARRAKFQGFVTISVEIDENGRVGVLRVLQPAGLGLDEKAIEAVKQWRFKPAMRDGRPVAAPAQIQVSFRLL